VTECKRNVDTNFSHDDVDRLVADISRPVSTHLITYRGSKWQCKPFLQVHSPAMHWWGNRRRCKERDHIYEAVIAASFLPFFSLPFPCYFLYFLLPSFSSSFLPSCFSFRPFHVLFLVLIFLPLCFFNIPSSLDEISQHEIHSILNVTPTLNAKRINSGNTLTSFTNSLNKHRR